LGEEDDTKHIILKCLETKKGRAEYVNSNWFNMNEDLAYKKIISCINLNRIKALGKYLFNPKCKWNSAIAGPKPG
jgi:hypothetical protein